jgi:uncharacterized protein YdeI (YjbR/CyaY-like superfamily)
MKPTYFPAPAAFRRWLEHNHASATELWVGFYKKGTGKPSITWPEAVDQLLCFGWIDGVRRSLGEESYVIRVTPRRPGSIWSAVNIARFGELELQGLVAPAGRRAFERRSEERSRLYSHEQAIEPRLEPAFEERLRADVAAWVFYTAQTPTYRRAAAHWVMSAKREETRERRLARLIADSAAARTVPPLTWGGGARG